MGELVDQNSSSNLKPVQVDANPSLNSVKGASADKSLGTSSLEHHSLTDPIQIASAIASLPIQIVPASACDTIVTEKKGRFSVISEASPTVSTIAQNDNRSLHSHETAETLEQNSLNGQVPTGVTSIPIQIVPARTVDNVITEKKGRFSIITSKVNSSPVPSDSPRQDDPHQSANQSHTNVPIQILLQQPNTNTQLSADHLSGVNSTHIQNQPNTSFPPPPQLLEYCTPPNPQPKSVQIQIPISPARTIQGQSILNANSISNQYTHQNQPQHQQTVPVKQRKGRFIVSNVTGQEKGHIRTNSAGNMPSEYSQPLVHSGVVPASQQISHTVQTNPQGTQPNFGPQTSGNSNHSQGSGTPPLAPSTTAAERINSAACTSSSGKGGLSSAIPGGMGKMFHFLDQLRLEITEADKMIKSLQSDVKFLRGKNKALEAKCNDAEKRLAEERTCREEAEAKVRSLKRRLKEIKESSSTKEMNDDDNEKKAMNQTFEASPAISYTNSHTNSPIGLNCIDLPEEGSLGIVSSEKAIVDAIAESLTSVDLNL